MPRKRKQQQALDRAVQELGEKITRLLDSMQRDKERLDRVLKELLERAKARRRPRIIAELGVCEPFPWEMTIVAE